MLSLRTHAALPAVLALAGADFLAAPAQAQNLVQNGSFEQGTFTDNGNGAQALPIGSTVLPGWTTTNAELVWLVKGNIYVPSTPYGSYFLDLTGYHDSFPYGGVTQTIATAAGQSYQFSFALGTDQDQSIYRGPVSATASAGSATQSFTFAPANGTTGSQWQVFSLNFVATGSSTALTLTGTGTSGGDYIGLDNVSVTENSSPVPEASTTVSFGLLLALGLGGGVVARRRRDCLRPLR